MVTRRKGMHPTTTNTVASFLQQLVSGKRVTRSGKISDKAVGSSSSRSPYLAPRILLGFVLVVWMGFFSPFRRTASNRGMHSAVMNSAHQSGDASTAPSSSFDTVAVQAVVSAALWSFFAGDALASPTHWFYGGFRQVQQYYGAPGITGYTKPVTELAGSILNKSNLSGGGRTTPSSSAQKQTIIGHVINHGKQDWWSPSKQIHYHATLSAGENTLEASLARVLLQSLAATGGTLDVDHFRSAYVTFMTTPGSHNDTYASTCHRMFFANWFYKKLPPKDCPDNDRHNVDTIDGLVLPTITALAVALQKDGTVAQAASQAAATVAVTRNSKILESYASEWAAVVFTTVRNAAAARVNQEGSPTTTLPLVRTMAQKLRLRAPQIKPSDEITACYLDSAVPAMLDTIIKYQPTQHSGPDIDSFESVWTGLLANANTGGENVHRGSCLGAVWGATAAAASTTTMDTDTPLVAGLYHRTDLQKEIQALLDTANVGAREDR